jgi:hypothetical protein
LQSHILAVVSSVAPQNTGKDWGEHQGRIQFSPSCLLIPFRPECLIAETATSNSILGPASRLKIFLLRFPTQQLTKRSLTYNYWAHACSGALFRSPPLNPFPSKRSKVLLVLVVVRNGRLGNGSLLFLPRQQFKHLWV